MRQSSVTAAAKPAFSKLLQVFLVITFALCSLSVFASPQSPEDTVFEEILLDEEGVSAVDTFGFNWHYDFDMGVFVFGDQDASEDPSLIDRTGLEQDFEPVAERCTEERVVKPFVSSVLVGYDEYVDGNIIAYDRVTVKGWVKGDVKAINKRVLVTASGQVDGDIEAPEILVKKGGVVLGEQKVTDSPLGLKDITETVSLDGVIVVVILSLVFLFTGFLVVSLAPKQFEVFNGCFRTYPVRSSLLGFFAVIFMPFLILLLMITIVGIVLVPFVPLLYILAIILGVTSFGNRFGGFSLGKLLTHNNRLTYRTLAGVLIFTGLWVVVAILLSSPGGVANGFGIFLLVLSIIISIYPVFGGVGAAILTRFGFRNYVSWRQAHQTLGPTSAPPAPPPIPARDISDRPPPPPKPHSPFGADSGPAVSE